MDLKNIRENKVKVILQFSIPSIIAMLLTSLITVADGYFMGNYVGEEGLAAVNLGLPIVYLYLAVGLIFSVGGAFLCVNAFDYGNKAETTAVITDFESYRERAGGKWRTRYKTHLTYEVDGESYDNTVKMYSSSWNIGEKIEIYC